MANTYKAVPSRHPHAGKWVIQVSVDGVVQSGTLGGGFETEADAQYWINRLMAQDQAEAARAQKRPARPRDPNQLAKLMVDIASGEAWGDAPTPIRDDGKDPAAVSLGRRGGLKGGTARAEKLTSEERSEIARRAAIARWKR